MGLGLVPDTSRTHFHKLSPVIRLRWMGCTYSANGATDSAPGYPPRGDGLGQKKECFGKFFPPMSYERRAALAASPGRSAFRRGRRTRSTAQVRPTRLPASAPAKPGQPTSRLPTRMAIARATSPVVTFLTVFRPTGQTRRLNATGMGRTRELCAIVARYKGSYGRTRQGSLKTLAVLTATTIGSNPVANRRPLFRSFRNLLLLRQSHGPGKRALLVVQELHCNG